LWVNHALREGVDRRLANLGLLEGSFLLSLFSSLLSPLSSLSISSLLLAGHLDAGKDLCAGGEGRKSWVVPGGVPGGDVAAKRAVSRWIDEHEPKLIVTD
jgi:hypothetical protein